MSEEIWPVPITKIEKALRAWQAAEPDDDITDAEALIDALAANGLQILPLVDDDAPCVVEVDGSAVSRPHLPAPHPANEAAGLWLAVRAERGGHVVLRPATAEEIAEAAARDRESVKPWLSSSS